MHTDATPLHPRCDRKSAEALETKGVVERPLRKRVRKMKKEKGIDENGARKLQMRDFVRWPPRRAGDWPFAKGAPRQDRGKLGKRAKSKKEAAGGEAYLMLTQEYRFVRRLFYVLEGQGDKARRGIAAGRSRGAWETGQESQTTAIIARPDWNRDSQRPLVRPLCTTIRRWLEALERVPQSSPPPVPQLQLENVLQLESKPWHLRRCYFKESSLLISKSRITVRAILEKGEG